MPFIQVTMIEGRSVEQKHALIKALTDAAVATVNTTPENVRVALSEVAADHLGVAGEAMSVVRARAAGR